jgi:hypothetical protein
MVIGDWFLGIGLRTKAKTKSGVARLSLSRYNDLVHRPAEESACQASHRRGKFSVFAKRTMKLSGSRIWQGIL